MKCIERKVIDLNLVIQLLEVLNSKFKIIFKHVRENGIRLIFVLSPALTNTTGVVQMVHAHIQAVQLMWVPNVHVPNVWSQISTLQME